MEYDFSCLRQRKKATKDILGQLGKCKFGLYIRHYRTFVNFLRMIMVWQLCNYS